MTAMVIMITDLESASRNAYFHTKIVFLKSFFDFLDFRGYSKLGRFFLSKNVPIWKHVYPNIYRISVIEGRPGSFFYIVMSILLVTKLHVLTSETIFLLF